MHFSIQLSAYYPDKSYGGDRVYRDMLEQARCADQYGYESVGITEHHLINILMMPAPLQFAVKIASQTQNVKIITAVSVLPLARYAHPRRRTRLRRYFHRAAAHGRRRPRRLWLRDGAHGRTAGNQPRKI